MFCSGGVTIKGIIFDIRKYSIHDGPGIRTTIFFKGCPLICWWCHNPEGQAPTTEVIYRENRCIHCRACLTACEHGALSWIAEAPVTDREKCTRCGVCTTVCYAEARECAGREMTVAEVLAEIERDLIFYDQSGGGVTLSGGEPLYQPDFALALLETCKERKIHTVVDTCGFVTWEIFDNIRKHTDLFIYDLKLMVEAKHQKYTGVSNDVIIRNLQELSRRGHNIILRVPVIPGINDDDENIGQIGALAATLTHLNAVDLLPYHHLGVDKYGRLEKTYRLPEIRPPSHERMMEIAHLLSKFDLCVRIGD